MAVDQFTNRAVTNITSGGTTAPASGTVETWTAVSWAGFPAAVTGLTQFRIVDTEQPTEIILVTNLSGTTATVTRGAEGTTPVAHSASGFTVYATFTAAVMSSFPQQLAPSGDTSGAADAAAISAAVAASGAAALKTGTWYLNATIGPLATGQWITCQPGVIINWLGTGDCFRFTDSSTYTTRTLQGGGITGRPVIDGTGHAPGASSGIHAGDILGLRLDVIIQNFTGAGDILLHLDNQEYWTEQAQVSAYLHNGTTLVVFDCGGASTSTGSFDRGDFTFCVSQLAGNQGVVLQNGAQIVGGRLRIFGNVNSSSSPLSTAVLTLTGSTPGGHSPSTFSGLAQSELDINVECDEGLADAPKTVSFGSSSNAITGCSGNLSFGAGSLFTQSNITSISGQFSYLGPVTGDATLSEQTIASRLSVGGQAFFFSSLYLGELGSPPSTPSGGGILYADSSGNLHYIAPSGSSAQLTPAPAAPAVFRPSNPATTVSPTLVMMGLGSACAYTPAGSGLVMVTVSGVWYTTTGTTNGELSGRYGTGTAPSNGAAVSGTRYGTGSSDPNIKAASFTAAMPFAFTDLLTLTPGTAYWFDLTTSSAGSSDPATITNVSMVLVELP